MMNKRNIFIFVIWCLVALVGIFFHEIWRDEAQVWCIVRDLGFWDIFQATRIEGHPMLWYLLLLPFAKLGAPAESMLFVSFSLTAAATLFLLYKSPFRTFEKVFIAFSAGMVYFLPAIARNYALIPLFLFMLAYYYPKRSENPYKYAILLALLSQTHVLILGFCSILFAFFAYENIKERKGWGALGLLFANFLFLFLSFYAPSTENVVVQAYSQHNMSFSTLLNDFCYIYFDSSIFPVMQINLTVFYIALAILAFCFFKQDKKICALFLGSFAYIFFIFAKVWFGGVPYQKAFILLLIIVFCYWVSKKNFKLLGIAFSVLMIISVSYAIPSVINEVKYNFSGSKQLATYIKNNLQEDNFRFLGYWFTISPLSAYLPDKNFYGETKGDYITYYDFRMPKVGNVIRPLPNTEYFITQESVFLFKELGFELIYETDSYILGPNREAEVYRLYKRKKL